jgi:Alkylmercury lyase
VSSARRTWSECGQIDSTRGASLIQPIPARWHPRCGSRACRSHAASEAECCRGCCPVLNFFASSPSVERWLAEHPLVRGRVVSIDVETVAGRAIFASVLR